MNKIAIMCCGVAAGLSATAAQAQDTAAEQTGPYGALHIGVAIQSDTDLDYSDEGGTFGGTGAIDTIKTSVDSKSALDFGGTLGYDFGIIRSDIEVDYSRSKIRALTLKSVNGTAVATIDPADANDFCDYAELDTCSVSGNRISINGGRLRQLSALANVWVDLPVGGAITPYVGGGLGIGGFEIEGEGKAKFAWQLGAGVAFDISPAIALTADYRYRQFSSSNFTDDDFPEYALRVGKIKTSRISAGIRFKF